MLSPSGFDAPTPPPQPSPGAFSPRTASFLHQQQRQFAPPQQQQQQQNYNSHPQSAFSPQRANMNYTSPRYDGPQQRLDDRPINGYSHFNGDYNVSQNQGQQHFQGRPRQSPTQGRKQFVSNGPVYLPSANVNYNVETNNNFDHKVKVADDDLALCRLVSCLLS